jgi:hypothetical protein
LGYLLSDRGTPTPIRNLGEKAHCGVELAFASAHLFKIRIYNTILTSTRDIPSWQRMLAM